MQLPLMQDKPDACHASGSGVSPGLLDCKKWISRCHIQWCFSREGELSHTDGSDAKKCDNIPISYCFPGKWRLGLFAPWYVGMFGVSGFLIVLFFLGKFLFFVNSHHLERRVGRLVDEFGLARAGLPTFSVDFHGFHVLRPVGFVHLRLWFQIYWLFQELIIFIRGWLWFLFFQQIVTTVTKSFMSGLKLLRLAHFSNGLLNCWDTVFIWVPYEKYFNLINSLYNSRSSLKELALELDSDLKIGV